jgi:hypothetical protein
MTSRQYRHIYVYAYNEQDYGGPEFDGLRNPEQFRQRLEELRAAGLAPVVWLFPDDAPIIHGTSTSALQAPASLGASKDTIRAVGGRLGTASVCSRPVQADSLHPLAPLDASWRRWRPVGPIPDG